MGDAAAKTPLLNVAPRQPGFPQPVGTAQALRRRPPFPRHPKPSAPPGAARRFWRAVTHACRPAVHRSVRGLRGPSVRPPDHDLRSLPDAVLHMNRAGIPWRCLPHNYPHRKTVHAYTARRQEEGVSDQISCLPRQQARQREGRDAEPTPRVEAA
ncbi:transposase [Streptomyces sp. NPDC004838]